MELSELSSHQEASLFRSGLEEWQEGPQVLTYGAILICRKGKAMLNVNYKDWELYEGAVITLFPNDVVKLKLDEDCKSLKRGLQIPSNRKWGLQIPSNCEQLSS